MRHKAAQSQTEAEPEGRRAADKPTLTGVGPRQIAVHFYEAVQDWGKFLQKFGKK